MRLHRLTVQGFRRLNDVTVLFGDATFCIGANNVGKSSILRALQVLLSGSKNLPESDFYSEIDPATGAQKVAAQGDQVVLEAEFRDVPDESDEWRGFKGRVLDGVDETSGEPVRRFFYRKTFPLGKPVIIEVLSKKRNVAGAFARAETTNDLVKAGLPAEALAQVLELSDKKLTAAERKKLDEVNEYWDIDDEEEWVKNPGGIVGNVLSKLPRYIIIPAKPSSEEIDGKGGELRQTLGALFDEVRDQSENYKVAQEHLDRLANELNPADATSEFGKMMTELNDVLAGVFPETQINVAADLSDPNKAISPTFEVTMSSNVETDIERQGTGVVRAAVFGLLRFRQKWLSEREDNPGTGPARRLIVGFEEPEIYLHPSAANQMRDTIYELSEGSQIIATTHSPYLVDLSRKPRQILNRLNLSEAAIEISAFNTTTAYRSLEEDDKQHVKMIMRLDDYVSRAFFSEQVVVVEGDTEDVVLREAIRRMEPATRDMVRSKFEVVKARGKASIIGLAKYLTAVGIAFRVIHDRDAGTPGAEKFNDPIREAVGDEHRVRQLEECMEDLLGYRAPSADKPAKAFQHANEWGDAWADVPASVKGLCRFAFSPCLDDQ